VSAAMYDIPDLAQKYAKQMTLNVPADSATAAFTIPEIENLSTTYFVRLRLKDVAGRLVGENVYWYSTQPDIFDFAKSVWYITPVRNYANLTGLNQLAKNSDLQAFAVPTYGEVQIYFINANKTNIAFFVHAEVIESSGDEIAPINYSDNYISLWPGEAKMVSAQFGAENKPASIRIKGYNVPEFTLRLK